MDSFMSYLTVVVGLALRLGLPVALTIILVILLHRLDTRWQKEGVAVAPIGVANTHCWEKQSCSPEKRAACTAFNHPETPCWQCYRSQEGFLREDCLGCQVFRRAPVPVTE
jgi:hypothetical protein